MADANAPNDARGAVKRPAFGSGSNPAPGALPSGAPSKIGRFELRALLGEGAFGRVYRGYDAELRREVAIKVPHAASLNDEFRERFLREARAVAAIHHPNVCPIFEVGTEGTMPYIVMRFVAGTTLAHIIDNLKTPMPIRNAVMIARKLALGMAAAHAQGVTHRDLKPANILYETANREVLITDFGLARVGGDVNLTARDSFLGTPAYTSPEQANRKVEQVGPLSDVYSLGVILYEMLTGDVPFNGSVMEVAIAHCITKPDPPSSRRAEIDAKLDAIVLRTMEKKPTDRYKSAREFSDVLTEYLRPGDSTAVQPGSAPELPSIGLAGGREPEPAVETVAENRSERRTAPVVDQPKPAKASKPAPPPIIELDEDEDEEDADAGAQATKETRRSEARKTTKQSKAVKKKKKEEDEEDESPLAALLQNKMAWAGVGLSALALVLLIVFVAGNRGPKTKTVQKADGPPVEESKGGFKAPPPQNSQADQKPPVAPAASAADLKLRNLVLGRWRITSGIDDVVPAQEMAKWKADKIYIYFDFKSDGLVYLGIDSFDVEVRVRLAKDFVAIPLKYRAAGSDKLEFFDVPQGFEQAGAFGRGVQMSVKIDGDDMTLKHNNETVKLIRVVLN